MKNNERDRGGMEKTFRARDVLTSDAPELARKVDFGGLCKTRRTSFDTTTLFFREDLNP